MPSIDVRPRVKPVLVRGTGYRVRGELTSVYERVHARERVEHEAERVSLGEVGEGCRRYTAYLAFNLINEGGSASVVRRLPLPSDSPSHFFPRRSPVTA